MTHARIVAIVTAVLLPAAALLWTFWPSEEGILLVRALQINTAAIGVGTLGLAVFRGKSTLSQAMVINLLANALGMVLAAGTLAALFGPSPRLTEDVMVLFVGVTMPASLFTMLVGYPVIVALKRLSGPNDNQPTSR